MFSVLLCVNEDGGYLDEAISSVLNQTFFQFELIIVANNCSDELYEKLENYTDSRIRLFRTSIGQLGFNLNYGVNEALYEYIVRMDADDICYPNRLEILKKEINDNPADFYCFSYDVIDCNGVVLNSISMRDNKIDLNKIFFRNEICHPTVAFNKKCFLILSGYSGGFQSEDLDLWFRLKRSGMSIFGSSKSVLKYRVHPRQSRGNVLPYCEVSGYLLRELLLDFSIRKFGALIISIVKRYIKPCK